MSEHEAGPPPTVDTPVSPPSLSLEPETAANIDAEFSTFYRDDIHKLVGFLIMQGATVTDATDVAQETMMKARQLWRTIRSPRAWCRRTAGRSLLRLIMNDREDPSDDVCGPDPLLGSADSIEGWELRHDLICAIATLPPRQRQVMAWTFDGFTPEEIAKEIGIRADTVRGNLKVARRSLAAYIEKIERTSE